MTVLFPGRMGSRLRYVWSGAECIMNQLRDHSTVPTLYVHGLKSLHYMQVRRHLALISGVGSSAMSKHHSRRQWSPFRSQ